MGDIRVAGFIVTGLYTPLLTGQPTVGLGPVLAHPVRVLFCLVLELTLSLSLFGAFVGQDAAKLGVGGCPVGGTGGSPILRDWGDTKGA